MKLTATFLDEISHDIPHQNWGVKDWDKDFAAMKKIGIDKVVMIRCGWRRFMAYHSKVLAKQERCYTPPVDLVEIFLNLSEKHGMKFFFGNYTNGDYFGGDYQKEIDINKAVGEEVMERYGNHSAFAGWYLTQEIGRLEPNIINVLSTLGHFYKDISNNKTTLISPYIEGKKLIHAFSNSLEDNPNALSVNQHAREWDEIMSGIKDAIDIIAFQDGQCDYYELSDFLAANKSLTDRHKLKCWTNCETFDRDMPIKFLPIKWEKMLLKLKAAEKAGIKDAITFEFSHFMSPNSTYIQAHHLYNRYCEHFNIIDAATN